MSEYNINEDAQSGGENSGSQSDEPKSSSSQQQESAFPDEDEETITMLDVIEREDKLEEEASAVLGNSDEKNCTYSKGYVPRQALYSCVTCADGHDKMAAICLACSLECHDNHEMVELYTKRNYRCDCGNSKFKPGFECKLLDKDTEKLPLNDNNKYNHNFSGRYCICDKRYPPDESDVSAESNDEMWQCVVCEDWYHTKHLGTDDLPMKFEELICGSCVDKLDFVHHYLQPDVDTTSIEASDSNSDMTSSQSKNIDSEQSNQNCNAEFQHQPVEPSLKVEVQIAVGESDTNDSQLENKEPPQRPVQINDVNADVCILKQLQRKLESEDGIKSDASKRGPLFWPDCAWRARLCRCSECMLMYKAKECEFLLDDKDTVQYYEAQGKANIQNRGTPIERGMSELNRMNRVAVAEALHGYDELKTDLSNYLRTFADNKRVVREEDIHDFFQKLRSKKRPRWDS